jgi:hypothetical protein
VVFHIEHLTNLVTLVDKDADWEDESNVLLKMKINKDRSEGSDQRLPNRESKIARVDDVFRG